MLLDEVGRALGHHRVVHLDDGRVAQQQRQQRSP